VKGTIYLVPEPIEISGMLMFDSIFLGLVGGLFLALLFGLFFLLSFLFLVHVVFVVRCVFDATVMVARFYVCGIICFFFVLSVLISVTLDFNFMYFAFVPLYIYSYTSHKSRIT
jgi:hypothetical protein